MRNFQRLFKRDSSQKYELSLFFLFPPKPYLSVIILTESVGYSRKPVAKPAGTGFFTAHASGQVISFIT